MTGIPATAPCIAAAAPEVARGLVKMDAMRTMFGQATAWATLTHGLRSYGTVDSLGTTGTPVMIYTTPLVCAVSWMRNIFRAIMNAFAKNLVKFHL